MNDSSSPDNIFHNSKELEEEMSPALLGEEKATHDAEPQSDADQSDATEAQEDIHADIHNEEIARGDLSFAEILRKESMTSLTMSPANDSQLDDEARAIAAKEIEILNAAARIFAADDAALRGNAAWKGPADEAGGSDNILHNSYSGPGSYSSSGSGSGSGSSSGSSSGFGSSSSSDSGSGSGSASGRSQDHRTQEKHAADETYKASAAAGNRARNFDGDAMIKETGMETKTAPGAQGNDRAAGKEAAPPQGRNIVAKNPGSQKTGPRGLGEEKIPRLLAVANQKGGVGKTTTAINLATALCAIGQKVLLIDLDPQGNATTGLGVRRSMIQTSVYDVLFGDADAKQAAVATKVPGLSVMPSSIHLSGAEIELVTADEREYRLKKALRRPLPYDYVIIDCPPSLNLLTLNAMVAVDSILVPLQCEFYALEGLSHLVKTIERVRKSFNPDLDIHGIALTMFDKRNRLSGQVEADVREHFGDKVYKTVIPRNVRLSEAPSFGLPAIVYDMRSSGAQAYISLAKEVIRREKEISAAKQEA